MLDRKESRFILGQITMIGSHTSKKNILSKMTMANVIQKSLENWTLYIYVTILPFKLFNSLFRVKVLFF